MVVKQLGGACCNLTSTLKKTLKKPNNMQGYQTTLQSAKQGITSAIVADLASIKVAQTKINNFAIATEKSAEEAINIGA